MLFLIVAALSFGGITGVMSYRHLVRSVSARAEELPLAAELIQSVNRLRITFVEIRYQSNSLDGTRYEPVADKGRFYADLDAVAAKLRRYQDQLELKIEPNGSWIVDNSEEKETARLVQDTLEKIDERYDEDWVLNQVPTDFLERELDHLDLLVNLLPSHLQRRMQELKGNVRGQYRTMIGLTWTTSFMALGILFLLVKFFYDWIFGPLRVLVQGSRRVAAGDFNHRIELSTRDEMAELATAMNNMRVRFREIRDDLDRQVKQRTKEVVRSEQMASVGFLAAGVAHEINNPLASIAWSAESLESRLHDTIYAGNQDDGAEENEETRVLRTYLRRIQDEAFRCKGITEALLDFSRMGDVEKHDTSLGEIIEDVIDMVKHLGRYRNKSIEFSCSRSVIARVNIQEFKQVFLNLITNALDSLDASGRVEVSLKKAAGQAVLIVEDNGCGMSDEVREHLFEPFFTRRRDGQGTGLGLSISYRIVMDHGGMIEPSSEGVGRGSKFRVTLPLVQYEEKSKVDRQVA
jgi:two-component system NtrC family sensor kinase